VLRDSLLGESLASEPSAGNLTAAQLVLPLKSGSPRQVKLQPNRIGQANGA
jgi:hypothetical protein